MIIRLITIAFMDRDVEIDNGTRRQAPFAVRLPHPRSFTCRDRHAARAADIDS